MVRGAAGGVLGQSSTTPDHRHRRLFFRDSCKSGEKIIPKIFRKYDVFKIKF